MKIGINLTGVSFNDGTKGYRYRNFEDAVGGFFNNVINPLRQHGHDVVFYLTTYDSIKREQVLLTYTPVIKATWLDSDYNRLGGGDVVGPGKIMVQTYLYSLIELLDEQLDLVISTRFDIDFHKNPFTEYEYDFTKCNFLWREPEGTHIPIVSDAFIVFPHHMTENLIDAINESETNPPGGWRAGMHNIYVPMCNQVGSDNVKIVRDGYYRTDLNDLYTLTRKV